MAKASVCFAARMNVVSRAMTSSADCSFSARKNTERLSIDEMISQLAKAGKLYQRDAYYARMPGAFDVQGQRRESIRCFIGLKEQRRIAAESDCRYKRC